MFDLGSIVAHIKAKTEGFQQAIGQVRDLTGHTGSMISGVAEFGKKVVKVGALAVTAFMGAASAAGFFAVKSAGDFQQARIAFETMLGSAEKAGKLLKEVSDFAARTPFELPQVVTGAKQLLAYGVEAEKLIPTFGALGNIAAGVGVDKLPLLILAFGQVKAATRLTGAELRQFTESGVPMLEILAKQMGKTTAEIQEMISEGKVGFKDVEKALFSLSGEGGKFFNLMEKQSKTFDGVMSNLKDNVGRVARSVVGLTETGEVVKGGFFEKLSNAASQLLAWVDANREAIIAFLTQGLARLMEIGSQVIGFIINLVGWWRTMIDGFNGANPTLTFIAAIFSTIWDWVKQVAATVAGPLKEAWDRLLAAVEPLMPLLKALAQVFGAILFGVILGFISLLGFLIETVARIFSGVVQIISGALLFIQGLFQIVTGFFVGLLSGDWALFKEGWRVLWEGVKGIFVGAWNAITGIFQAAWNAIKNIFQTMFNFIIGNSIVPDLVNGILSWFNRIPSGVTNALRNVGNAIASPFQRGFDLIKNGVDRVRGFLERLNPFHRESPSLVDNITKGVGAIMKQFDLVAEMDFQRPALAMPRAQAIATGTPSINVSLDGAIIPDSIRGQEIGEMFGDSILKVLEKNVKF